MWRRPRAWLLGTPVALAFLCAPSPAAAIRLRNGFGLHVLSRQRLDQRLIGVSVSTAALPGPARVRILLPSGYNPRHRYPVLYLLHGTSGGAPDWTVRGGAEEITAGKPLIVVMPDIALHDDGGGWCTNWPDGAYHWESFHIGQLIPWVDHNFRTVRGRGGRAIAGLSQGGFCSISYAARHPDLFSVALAYSGAPDIYYDPDARAGARSVINATEVGLDHVPPNSMFGDPVTDAVNWAAHDPATLAANLRQTKLFMYFGNGQPGPYDPVVPNPYASSIEMLIYRDNIDFHNRLDALGIPSVYDPYGNGTHSWPYWARDLRWSIGAIMSDFAHPVRPPSRVTYTSADDRYAVYGWRVRMRRRAREFSTLQNASRRGFVLTGSGSARIVTPPLFARHARYRVTLAGSHVRKRLVVRTGRGRRLALVVPLGPANPYREYSPQAGAAGTAVYRTAVTIARVRR